jgi:predicted transcriptional regulator
MFAPLPKLIVRVRFSSPAPPHEPRSEAWLHLRLNPVLAFWLTSVPRKGIRVGIYAGHRSACRTDRDTLVCMSSAISVRLDSEAMQALAQLEATGISRSEAIRRAILDSAGRLRKRAALAAEVADLEADEDDRREMLEVAGFMESMRAPG